MKTLLLIPLWFVLATAAHAQWTGFRGANGVGVSSDVHLPVEWSETKNIRWKTDLPGRGNSSPVVVGDRIYLTTKTEDGGLHLLSMDRLSGEIVWQKKVGSGTLAAKGPERLWAPLHNAASPTPVADENHVWAFFGTGLLVCFGKDGEARWERDLVKDYGAYDITFGMGSSPRMSSGGLIINCMTKGPSYVLCLNPADGKEIWKSEREYNTPNDHPDSYATPAVRPTGVGEQLLIAGSAHLDAYDPQTGKRLWHVGGFEIESPYGRMVASPAISENGHKVVQLAGNPGGGGLGRAITFDIFSEPEPKKLWNYEKKTPDSSTPVIYNGVVYFLRDSGVGAALDLETGELLWEERLAQKGVYPAAVAGDDKVYLLASSGLCTVLKAGRKFEKLAANQLPGQFNATPAIAYGEIYLRSYDALWAIGNQ
ncbi:MAG: PQQ-binding-like beta-propeller repeat protein [Verrucomicrobiota bacterium]